jgi:hypothetical protein
VRGGGVYYIYVLYLFDVLYCCTSVVEAYVSIQGIGKAKPCGGQGGGWTALYWHAREGQAGGAGGTGVAISAQHVCQLMGIYRCSPPPSR